jgi:phage-related protein
VPLALRKILCYFSAVCLNTPHSRSMGGGLFELRAKGKEGIGRAFYCFQIGQRM